MSSEIKQILNFISKESKVEVKRELLSKIKTLKEKIEDSRKNAILKCVLDYLCSDNSWKNNEFSLFSEKLCQLNYEEDNTEIILKYFDCFSGILDYSLSIDALIKDKNLLCILKFKLLNRDIKELIAFIESLKPSFNGEKNIKEILIKINFDNYIHINFIHELLKNIFEENNNLDSNLLQKITSSINEKEYLRCKKCFDILYCYQENNLLNFICNNNHYTHLSPEQEKIETKTIKIKCNGCDSYKQIYENIYKCLMCKEFFCEKCKIVHEKVCFLCQFINLYQIGYICEKHNKLYSKNSIRRRALRSTKTR